MKNIFKDIDKDISKVVFKGINISFYICILAISMLTIYNISFISYELITGSIILFKTGIMFAISFGICGIIINRLKQDLFN